jgi:hypothetical protein
MKFLILILVFTFNSNLCYLQDLGTDLFVINTPCVAEFNVFYSKKESSFIGRLPHNIKYQGDFKDSVEFFDDSLNPWISPTAIVSYSMNVCKIDVDNFLVPNESVLIDSTNIRLPEGAECKTGNNNLVLSLIKQSKSKKIIFNNKKNNIVFIESKDGLNNYIIWRKEKGEFVLLDLDPVEEILKCEVINHNGIDRLLLKSERSYMYECQFIYRIIKSTKTKNNSIYKLEFY